MVLNCIVKIVFVALVLNFICREKTKENAADLQQ